jgi:hypothetical protein
MAAGAAVEVAFSSDADTGSRKRNSGASTSVSAFVMLQETFLLDRDKLLV